MVFLVARVEFCEFVALVVGGDVESWKSFLATDYESALNDRVTGYAVDGGATENILARSFEAGEETT